MTRPGARASGCLAQDDEEGDDVVVVPTMRVTGRSGSLRVGYQVAADLGMWSFELIDLTPRRFACAATITRRVPHWFRVGETDGFDLVLTLGGSDLVWRGLRTVTADSTRLSVELSERPEVIEWARGQQ